MTEIAGAKALYSAQVAFRKEAVALYQRVADEAGRVLLRASDASGTIPARQEAAVVRRVGEIAQRLFVGVDGRSPYASDGVTPLADYPAALNTHVARVTYDVVKAHHDWLRRNVPEDVFDWLASAPPVREQTVLKLDPDKLFHPDPLAQYDALHTWVDPNGYRLSDRVWQAGVRTRMQIDALLTEQIRNGNSALNISKKLEQFLLPNRAPLRTRRPYGRDASYDGMRLARTEITAAHGRATLAAARANPYVGGIRWRLSASHPRADICDGLAARSPYALNDVPRFPPHPHCLCCLIPVVTASPAGVTKALRALMARGERPPYVTPASLVEFLRMLLGVLLKVLDVRL